MSYPVKPKMAVASNLPPVENGSLLATTDTGEMYIDAGGNRVKLSDVITDTYSNIMNLVVPLTNKIYYATDTHQLFQATYTGQGNTLTWYELTGYSLPTASTNTLGGVKVDGTTIIINNGVISVASGVGGGGSYGTQRASNAIIPAVEATDGVGYVAGTARGYGSTDLQTYRTSVSQVVSGGYSFGAGTCNTCVGHASAIFGSHNSSHENYCAVFGTDNIAEGEATFILGRRIEQTTEGAPQQAVYFGQDYTTDIGDAVTHNVVLDSNGDVSIQADVPHFGHTGTKGIMILQPINGYRYLLLKVGRLSAAILQIQLIEQYSDFEQDNHYYTDTYTIYKNDTGTNAELYVLGANGTRTYDHPFVYDANDYTIKYRHKDSIASKIQFGIRYTILGKGHMNKTEDPYYEPEHHYDYYGYYDNYYYGS